MGEAEFSLRDACAFLPADCNPSTVRGALARLLRRGELYARSAGNGRFRYRERRAQAELFAPPPVAKLEIELAFYRMARASHAPRE